MTDPNQIWLEGQFAARPELRFDFRGAGDAAHVVVEDPLRGKFFQVGLEEYALLKQLDGRRTLTEICENGSQGKSAEQKIAVLQWLVQNNLAYATETDNSSRMDHQSRMVRKSKRMAWLNPISCKITLGNPNQLLARLQPYTQWLFSWWAFVLWLFVAGYAMVVLFGEWNELGAATRGILAGQKWIWMLLIWVVLKVIHEIGHGIACRRFGGEVPEAGVLLLLFTPMAFVNVTSMWRLSNRWQRIVVSAAGMYIELFISFMALIVWKHDRGVIGSTAFDVFLMSSVTTVLFNANPLMRFDGYFILSDLLNIPNLYSKGTKWFSDSLKRIYFGVPGSANNVAPNELAMVRVYGTLAWVWKILIGVSLCIGASVLFEGAGIALAVVGAFLWYGLPVLREIQNLFGPQAKQPVRPRRMIFSLGSTVAIAVMLFFILNAPATKSAPAIVQFSGERILRAKSEGFLTEILVEDGAAVIQNQTLVVLENPQLEQDVVDLEQQLKAAKIETNMHRQTGELAKSQAAAEKQASLNKQLAEKRKQLDGMTIKAPFDGVVHQRGLQNRIGSYASRGDAILSISDVATREILVSIDQRDSESLKGKQGQEFRVVVPGIPVFPAKVSRVVPRADTRLIHTTLGAHAGGPLAVKPVDDPQSSSNRDFELLDPRFTVKLEPIPTIGQTLVSGQRGYAFYETKRQSLGKYLIVAVSDWLQKKIEIATQTAVF